MWGVKIVRKYRGSGQFAPPAAEPASGNDLQAHAFLMVEPANLIDLYQIATADVSGNKLVDLDT
jgi:hypothetical protein